LCRLVTPAVFTFGDDILGSMYLALPLAKNDGFKMLVCHKKEVSGA
jgi:hypothetical protein